MDYLNILNTLKETSPAEFAILPRLLRGKNYQEIAKECFLTVGTVRQRTKRICTKFGISTASQAKLMSLFYERSELMEWIENSGSSIVNNKLLSLDYSKIKISETISYRQANDENKDLGVGSLAVSPDNDLLAIAYWDGTLRLIDTTLWKDKIGFNSELKRHANRISSVIFTPDGETLITGSCDKTVKLWKIPTGELLYELSEHSHFVEAIAISKDGSRFATASWDKTVKIYKFGTNKQIKYLTEIPVESEVMDISFSPSNEGIIALACFDGTVQLWNYHTSKLLNSHNHHQVQDKKHGVINIVFHPNASYIASYGTDDSIKLCKWENNQIILSDSFNYKTKKNKDENSHYSYCLTFNPDGQILASVNWDGSITLWNCNTGNKIKQLNSDSGKFISVTFNDDGKLITGDELGIVQIWDASCQNK